MVVVRLEGRACITCGVQHDKVGILFHQLCRSICFLVVCFQCESDDALSACLLLSQSCCNVVSGLQVDVQVVLFSLNLRIGEAQRLEISHGSAQNGGVGSRKGLLTGFVHLLAAFYIDAVDTFRARYV